MEDDKGVASRVDKLLPKAISAKRRLRKEKKKRDGEGNGEEDGGSRSRNSSPAARRWMTTRQFSTTSSNTNSNDEDVDDRSLGSYDSSLGNDVEMDSSNLAIRPTLSAHASQIGYLTTSSPVVQATHLDSQSVPSLTSQLSSRSQAASKSDQHIAASTTADTTPFGQPALQPPEVIIVPVSDRRTSAGLPSLDTKPPRTPPNRESSTPLIVNTPPTPTDPRESTALPPALGAQSQSTPQQSSDSSVNPNGSNQSIWNMNVHKRSKSGPINLGPSKLSNITSVPLTPTPENGEPQSSITNPTTAGFFSSVFSAAQNAANSFTNLQPNGATSAFGSNKSRSSGPKSISGASLSSSTTDKAEPAPVANTLNMDKKDSAVRTMGVGDLSLSQLGLTDPVSAAGPLATQKFPDTSDSRSRSESAPADSHTTPNHADVTSESSSRPRSLNEAPSGDRTPPSQHDPFMNKSIIPRTPSLRSALKPHRKRGSSVATAATGTTIAGVVTAASSTLGNAGAAAPGAPKLTGFAIASKKRNRDFHSFFKSVPDDDYLIEDYSCALQREILAHGRLYVSEGHLCFSSNILGWTTTLVMSFDEIVSVEKRSTALLFKNGLMISTLHAKHIFASFTSRDATYDLIVNIWKLGHPTLKSTQNGMQLEGTGGDKTEKVSSETAVAPEGSTQAGSESEEDSSDEDDDYYDEDEQDTLLETQTTEASIIEGEIEKIARKASGAPAAGILASDPLKETEAPAAGGVDFPGPATHAPTDCGDSGNHYDRIVGDDVIPAPLGKVYSLLFGQSSPVWMGKWLTAEQKCFDLQMEDRKGLSLDDKTRSFSYIKPLYASIGPKQTKCMVTEVLENLDLEKSVNLSVSTQNPDVPNGNIFMVRTKYCLSWAEGNATRVQVNCTTEWSGKSWIKGPIEKGVNDGQTQYCKDLFVALKSAVSTKPARLGAAVAGGATRGRKKGKKAKAAQGAADDANGQSQLKNTKEQNWGLAEPIRPFLQPVVDILGPVFTGNITYGILVGLLVATWFGFGATPGRNAQSYDQHMSRYNPGRFAAYEEMWRHEDAALWEWLEERVGLERLNVDRTAMESSRSRPQRQQQQPRKKEAVDPRTVEKKLQAERMGEREVEEAIRVTEEKLRVLKEVMDKRKRGSGGIGEQTAGGHVSGRWNNAKAGEMGDDCDL